MLKKYLLKSIRPIGAGLILIIAFLSLISSEFYYQVDETSFLKQILDYTISFEDRFYDYRMVKTIPGRKKSKDIVLLEIDDFSLSKLGHWPLNRTVYADLLRKLTLFGARVVAFDIFFPEKSPGEGPSSPDQRLIQSFRDFRANDRYPLVGYTLLDHGAPDEEKVQEFPAELFDYVVNTRQKANANLRPLAISAYNYPIPGIAESGVGLGFISMEPDPDGTFRNYQFLANVDQFYVGSLGYLAYELWSGTRTTVEITDKDGTPEASLEIHEKKLEIDPRGQTPIRFWGGEKQFPHTSLYDVLTAKDTDEEFRGFFQDKLVFVGSTAQGAHDLRNTPLSSNTPGVYAHINMAHMLINGYFFKPKEESLKYSLILLFAGIILFVFAHRFDNPILDALTIIFIIGGSYAADYSYFLEEGYQLKLFYCYFCFVATYSWNTFLNFYEANREKRQIRNTFARYVAPTVVEEMLKDPEHIQVGGKRMDITCLFSDVRDFTSISEGLSAQELANMLNEYMSKMTDIVFETKGTLDKYIGDAIVAIWGAPVPIGNHAHHAVEAAVRMAEAMPEINAEFQKRSLPFFHVGIGINTGECSVGNMGSTRIFSYTALGDNMNLGARLEGLCKFYGSQILISENTLEQIDRELFKFRPIDKVIVKGRTKPVEIFEVISKVHPMAKNPDSLQHYLTGQQFFIQKKFKGALEVFEQILSTLPEDKPTKRLKSLCENYLAHPENVTPDFDVTKMTEK